MPVLMRSQRQPLLQLLLPSIVTLVLELLQDLVRSSSPVLVRRTLIARRRVVGSRVASALVRLLRKREMEDVDLGTRNLMIMRPRHSRDGDWEEEGRRICK
jgi:hypothetical protein